MINNEAGSAYRQTEALTTDPVGLVVVLYDMLLKDLREAVQALAENNIEQRAACVRHSILVLQQLQSTLDMGRGGTVAQNLERFYNFTRAKLLEAQIKASAETFAQQITFVSSIRDAWQQVRQQQEALAEAALTQATNETEAGAVAESSGLPMEQWSA